MLVYYFMHKQKRSKLFASHKNWVREGGWLNLSKLNYFITPFFPEPIKKTCFWNSSTRSKIYSSAKISTPQDVR